LADRFKGLALPPSVAGVGLIALLVVVERPIAISGLVNVIVE
jgi:hypothetical protein